jgi:hypothetical protein
LPIHGPVGDKKGLTEKCGEAVLNGDKLVREGPRHATLGDDSACADHTYSGCKPRADRRKSRERGLFASALQNVARFC